MRRDIALPAPPAAQRHDWQTVRMLLPYLLQWRGRILLALGCLITAKLANVAVPLVFKDIIDGFAPSVGVQGMLVVPLALIAAYGVLRFSVSLFTELRELLFTRITQQAVRSIALQVFEHLHQLSLRFHLERQTGGLTRDIERGTRAIGSLISYTIYSILPTLVEVALVLGILAARYEPSFVLIASGTLVIYIAFTITLSNWRVQIRREVNELDSAANTRAIDSLLNYETVKYFNNEGWEKERYDQQMKKWAAAQIKSQFSLSYLNLGQAAIIAVGVSLIMWRAAVGVANGSMTIGDIVLVNVFLIQLYIPLNFLGVLYREIRQSLTDIERLFVLLNENREIRDAADARSVEPDAQGACAVRFENVSFAYEPRRSILQDVSFDIPAGRTLAVVGHSGAGKSTLARLLFRFYDVNGGAIRINGQDIRQLTQASLRSAIGIVPQDTVLFNDTLAYNIQYGRPTATFDEVKAAAHAAHLAEFIERLPDGYETRVGERGLKLSGGEKQRVAIARTLLKNPPILIFDEATSALDSQTEKSIQAELEQVARGRTTLIIAHRLSTVMNADEILVLDQGRIVESGSHRALLERAGAYAKMWWLQQQEDAI
ncbi:MAG: ABC transporter ATP-binding protein/permease [Gammaproteobacteria bacterium]|nr:ABC transporter ATP-binding protein/permease [Rhodocyclaceae bacterium]MBU3910629.1 ABC transporter ATP-binding protein/permease [Gammaproteobacteria bacterium]MBU4005110.1 ABC transporter ATP-binding protein/permease [Gammaproteobacteria bacterium]MBU4020703.1 ABC transporter ATP-binding protein/permease [Gammaproteobacteria bacterium]MBU4095779.1 ABC transporter ATP-binding protein/permease [Gammaproteobacteria bacterium]